MASNNNAPHDLVGLSLRLHELAIHTGDLKHSCLGCGYEHDCGIHGCAVLLAAVVFGPGAGFAVGAVADIIGGVLAGYAINPLITLGAGAIGLVAGFAWQKLSSLSTNLRLAASVLLGHFVGSMVITLLALRLFYGYPWATLAVRIPNALILSAVNVVLLRILLENRSLMKLAKK